LTYIIYMEFIETRVFTRQITGLLSDTEYHGLQHELIIRPTAGAMIKASSGIRKIRWRAKGKGKSGGIRIIYYYLMSRENLYMLVAYSKKDRADLTQREIRALKQIVEKLT